MRRSAKNPLLVGDLVVWDFGREKWIGTVVEAWGGCTGSVRRYEVTWSHNPGSRWTTSAFEVVTLVSGPEPKLSVVQVRGRRGKMAPPTEEVRDGNQMVGGL